MASLIKRGKSWQVRWREAGVARAVTAPDKRTAQEIQREVERCVALGQSWQPRGAREELGVDDAMRMYILEIKRALAPATAVRYAQDLEAFRAFLGERHRGRGHIGLDVLSQALLAEFWEWAENGRWDRERSVSTRRKLIQGVQRWWAWCATQDELEQLTPRPKRLRLPRALPTLTVAPTWEEMDSVIHAFDGWRRRLAFVLRFTGLRVGQAMGLRWTDLNVATATLTIRPELGKTAAEKSGRRVPVSAHLVAELAGWGAREGWLIETGPDVSDRSRAARAEMMARGWRRAGVRPEAWQKRPQHAFRKGFRSGLTRAGADSAAIEFLLGHDLGLVGVYTDPEALPLRAAVNLIPPLARPVAQLGRTRGQHAS